MLKYYLDIEAVPDPELSINFIISKAFFKVHCAIAKKQGKIAAAFPGIKRTTVGNIIRLFAETREELEALDLKAGLECLNGAVYVKKIKTVPAGIESFSIYSRIHAPASIQATARRYVKRHNGISYEEVLKRYKKSFVLCNTPYLLMESSSSRQKFSLFVDKKKATFEQQGEFNSYGLSNSATVPVFA